MDNKLPQTCHLCQATFSHNRDGRLTKHLEKEHLSSLEDYVIATEYNGIIPQCSCGFCTERPLFYRGAFCKFAQGHNAFEMREKLYVEKNGKPLCPICQKTVGFRRGQPKKYCSFECQGKDNGFSRPETQKTIQANVQKKYGVSNVAKLPEVKQLISVASTGRSITVSDQTKKLHSEASKKRWSDTAYRAHMCAALKIACNKPEERLRRKQVAIEKMNNVDYVKTFFGAGWGFLSKLHSRIREALALEAHGFRSEQQIGRYIVDELNDEWKCIIEINGNYIHANPKIYSADAIIRIPGDSYLAQEKWERDEKRLQDLKMKGYQVFVIWEDDDLAKWRNDLADYIRSKCG